MMAGWMQVAAGIVGAALTGGVVGHITGWSRGKRVDKRDDFTAIIAAYEKMYDEQKQVIEDLRGRVGALETRVRELEIENHALRSTAPTINVNR